MNFRLSPDTKDAILFVGGCIGMAAHGLVLPIMGEGFVLELFLAWMGLTGIGVFGGMDSRRNGKNGASA